MPEDRPEIEIDFEAEMRAFSEKSNTKNTSAANGNLARIDRGELTEIIGQMIRPLAVQLEELKHGPLREHNVMLAALAKSLHAHGGGGASGAMETLGKEVQRLGSIEKELQRLGSVETANSKLFDAMHAELKSYKDNFIFDSIQRPYIRDLVSLFDDLTEVHAQTERRVTGAAAKNDGQDSEDDAFLRMIAGNLENQIAHMIEIFLRMDVIISRTCAGAPLDKKNHRTVSIEPAASPGEDATVVRSIKPGFTWRERTIRPEDVVVRRWTAPGSAPASPKPPSTGLIPPPSAQP